mgnify:CR=1 FL=1
MNIRMKSSNGNVVIDGRSFNGKNIVIGNGKVTIDGVEQEGELVGEVNITVNGDVDFIENSSGKVEAVNVGSVKTQSGDVVCGDVNGNVTTMSGKVSCCKIAGSVSTMSGDIINI